MPIATPQGTLDFKSVDKVTFVGASSNTVIDTTTGSLGVGVGVGGPTSNLHVVGNTRLEGDINMLHTSNTTAIKLNSNVVTEFPRSKKLIKYPRVNLTSASYNAYESGYKVTRSNAHSSYREWEAFDGMSGDSVGWYSGDSAPSGPYYGTGGIYNGNTRLATETELGEWLGLELPESIKLQYLRLVSQSYQTATNTIDDFILYAKKQSGDTWTSLGLFTGKAPAQNSPSGVIVNIDANDYYKFFVIVARKSAISSLGVSIRELEYYGVPEYDPDAHGTDVTLKSLTNVPNTDWLEVYYDAKNYSGVGNVQDETTNNRDAEMNATFDNGEIKAFSFSGAYTSNVTTSDHGLGTGNVAYTISYWFKRTAVAGTYDYVVMLGNGGVSYSSILMWINNNYLNLDHWSASQRWVEEIKLDKWYHVTAGHKGGDTPSLENDFIYINGEKAHTEFTWVQTPSAFTLAGSKLTLGSEHNGTTEFFNGKIANFRLFNRALTSDEIYQLYAYQKEEFGHSTNNLTLKAGRLGIGTSEPRAMLDVKGDTFSKVYKGGRTTFLTWDYEGQRYTDISAANHSTYANVGNILDHTFDIPSCYHDLGTANLKAFVQIDWRGEVNKPWNFVFRIEVTYNGDQIANSSSSDHAASLNSRGCGIPTDSYHDDHYSTPEHASVTSLFKLTNCDVSPGSKLKVQLVGQWGDGSLDQRIWTGRTHGNINRADYELPTSSFFVVLDVDDGY